jgi:hypothetical protein
VSLVTYLRDVYGQSWTWITKQFATHSRLASVALIAAVLLAGVATPIYLTMPRRSVHILSADKSIYVSWPTVFLRERLLNENISEERSLKTELEEADKSPGTIDREIDSDIADRIVAQLDVGTPHQSSTSPSSSPSSTTGAPTLNSNSPISLLESLEDREALRARINEALAANNIYDSQDTEGKGLFRFQFSVSLLPPPQAPYSARIEVYFHPPKQTDAQLESLYAYLLARESVRLTEFLNAMPADTSKTSVGVAGAGATDIYFGSAGLSYRQKSSSKDWTKLISGKSGKTTVWLDSKLGTADSSIFIASYGAAFTTPNSPLTSVNWFGGPEEEYLEKRGLIHVYKLPMGQTEDGDEYCGHAGEYQFETLVNKRWPGYGAPPPAQEPKCTTLVLALPSDNSNDLQRTFNQMLTPIGSPYSKSLLTQTFLRGVLAKPSREAGALLKFLTAPGCQAYGPDISQDDEGFRRVAAPLVSQKDSVIDLYDPRPLFQRAGMTLRYAKVVNAMLERMATSEDLAPYQKAAAERLDNRLEQEQAEAESLLALYVQLRQTVQPVCSRLPPEFSATVPPAFADAVLDASTAADRLLRGEARPLRLEPAFRPIIERRQAAVSSSSSGKLGGTTTGAQADVAASRDRASKDIGTITQASIISFSENQPSKPNASLGQNGWILEPDQPGKANGVEWVQGPRNELLATDVALPAWWPEVDIEVIVFWADEESGKGGEPKKLDFKVPLPGMRQDSDSLLRFLTSESLIETKQPAPHLEYPSEDKHQTLDVCSNSSPSIIISGTNLWHSPRVFVGSQEATSVSLLPNMQGLTAKFDASQIEPSVPVPVYVATSTNFSFVGTITLSTKTGGCSSAAVATVAQVVSGSVPKSASTK